MLKKTLKNQKGFTLIEIIAVLVILGILAAVAVPKYMDLQGNAHKAAIDGAIAAATSNLNMSYAKYILAGGSNASVTVLAATTTPPATDLGDFTAAYTGPAGTDQNCTVTISQKTGGASWVTQYGTDGGTLSKTVKCPW